MDEVERRARDERDAEAWCEAALDPAFLAEVEALSALYAADDLRAWQD